MRTFCLLRPAVKALFLCLATSAAALTSAGSVDPFNNGWRFHLGDVAGAEAVAFSDTDWTVVSAPHTARLEARVTDKGEHQQWEGICWYRKTFTPPADAAGQVVLLRFEGAMNVAEAFVNGRKSAESLDGFTPFVVDLTEVARQGAPITIALRLDNRANEITGPKPLPVLDFHLYHGLYRGVSLIIKPPLHITDEILENRPASGGVFVTYPRVSEESAKVQAQVHVRNSGADRATFTVAATLRSLDGRVVARGESSSHQLAPAQAADVLAEVDVLRPQLWSPQSPTLYFLDADVLVDGRVVDSQRQRIGIRRFELRPGAIVINGRATWLRGVNRHQSYPYVGNAVPANAQFRDAWKIKQAGFDFVRLAHYPQSPDFLDACDELGLVVLDSILGWQYNPGTPAFMDNRVAAARALVRRDRNHACAMLWELSLNETPMTPEFIARLHRAGHEEFPGDQMATAGWTTGYDAKFTARQHGSTKEFANATFPCLVSEYGDWEYYAQNAGFNQEQWQNLKAGERSSRQARGDGERRLLQQATNLQEAHNENRTTQVFADAYWVMYDYNRGYAEDLETSGIADQFRLPKFSHAFFRSQRDPQDSAVAGLGGPMVTIASAWTESSPLAVRVFSNCEEVELTLNGRRVGRQRPDRTRISTHLAHPPFTFALERFEPGTLRAVGIVGDKRVAEHVVQTPGTPDHLVVSVDLSDRFATAGGDLLFLYAAVVDASGTTIPAEQSVVTFQVEGGAELVGDNPSAAEAGVAAILLRTGAAAGPIRVVATAGKLRGDCVVDVGPGRSN